uniref:Heat shock protein 70 n=1 Tax=Panagrolaimus sp. ES5 TaxID=591445 RepID=A0AC34GTF9_9BILA
MNTKKELPFAIDFGTTKTCGAGWWNEKVEVVMNELDSKRLLAKEIDNSLIEKFKSQWTFELKENRVNGNLCEYFVNDETENLSPVFVNAKTLQYMQKSAEKRFEKEISSVVISIPIYFSFLQIKEIYDAAKLVNLDVTGFITDTTATAITYFEFQQRSKKNENVFVVDIGGGGFSIAIIKYNEHNYQTLAASGSEKVGGRDFDYLIFEWMKEKLELEGMDTENLSQLRSQKKRFKMVLQANAVKEGLSVSPVTP